MDIDELMSIGRFARISGLSIHTLRHYDDVGLLAPAQVDPATGYRRTFDMIAETHGPSAGGRGNLMKRGHRR